MVTIITVKRYCEKIKSRQDVGIFHPIATLFDRYGSVWQRALLGQTVGYHGAYGKADGAAIRQTLCEDE